MESNYASVTGQMMSMKSSLQNRVKSKENKQSYITTRLLFCIPSPFFQSHLEKNPFTNLSLFISPNQREEQTYL